jgi:hypothetical protein
MLLGQACEPSNHVRCLGPAFLTGRRSGTGIHQLLSAGLSLLKSGGQGGEQQRQARQLPKHPLELATARQSLTPTHPTPPTPRPHQSLQYISGSKGSPTM